MGLPGADAVPPFSCGFIRKVLTEYLPVSRPFQAQGCAAEQNGHKSLLSWSLCSHKRESWETGCRRHEAAPSVSPLSSQPRGLLPALCETPALGLAAKYPGGCSELQWKKKLGFYDSV